MDVTAAPTNLAVGNPTTSSLHLTWTDNSINETRFEIERTVGSGTFQVIASAVPANATSYTDTDLNPQTSYSYRVRAFGTVASVYSNTAVATTSGDPPPPGPSGMDIGYTSPVGSTSGTPPAFTMQAAGSDIYGSYDRFHFLSDLVWGDVTIVCRVAAMTNTNP